MSELGEAFEGYRAAKQAKRASNRSQSADYLKQRGIPFTSHNDGAHLIVEGPAGYIDFWPGTGRWKDRAGPAGFGVRNLVTHVAGTHSEPPTEAEAQPRHYPDDFTLPLPDWAVSTAHGELCVGAQLSTRDGRRMGNAVICGERQDRHGCRPWPVATDSGTLLWMTDAEIAGSFWPPKWIMDPRTHPGVERLIASGWDPTGYLPGDQPPPP
jgi:hypothetical protein